MKKILLAFLFALGLASPELLQAQDFSITDTVWATTTNTAANAYITNNLTDSITLRWHVIATDFPADWLDSTNLGLCDNNVCYGNAGDQLWNPTTLSGNTFTSAKYPPGAYSGGGFDYSPNLTNASGGTHYITVSLKDLGTTATTTFVITRPPTALQNINNTETNVVLYPNPAHNELNIVYDASADVKNIAVYNIIGKVMAVYKVTDNTSANLSLENIPSGLYFVRLVNSHGDVVVTRKFTKQ